MGEAGQKALRLGFDRAIRLEFHGARVSSDAGLFPYRDLDDAAQLTESGAGALFDDRTGSNIQHSLTALIRQSVYSRLAGNEDVNDAERLSVDPVMRPVVGGRATGRQAASTSQMARFETEVLTQPDNLSALLEMPGRWVDLVRQRRPTPKLVLDLDSADTPHCRPACDGSAVVTRRRPVNLVHLEGSAVSCCAHGPRMPLRPLVNTAFGRPSGRIAGASGDAGLILLWEGVILVSEEPGSRARQSQMGNVG